MSWTESKSSKSKIAPCLIFVLKCSWIIKRIWRPLAYRFSFASCSLNISTCRARSPSKMFVHCLTSDPSCLNPLKCLFGLIRRSNNSIPNFDPPTTVLFGLRETGFEFDHPPLHERVPLSDRWKFLSASVAFVETTHQTP